MPDLLVIVDGRAIFLEVKQPGKKPTPLQVHRMRDLRKAGASTHVVTSWEHTKLFLDCQG